MTLLIMSLRNGKPPYVPRSVPASAFNVPFLCPRAAGHEVCPFPGFIVSALATLRGTVPSGAGYVHEIKFEGYRGQADRFATDPHAIRS